MIDAENITFTTPKGKPHKILRHTLLVTHSVQTQSISARFSRLQSYISFAVPMKMLILTTSKRIS